MKIVIGKRMVFEAAHYLPAHKGKCKNLHGHSFTVEVNISTVPDQLANGMVMDYSDLKMIMQKRIIDKYDHQYLNDISDCPSYPTSELLGLAIFNDLKSLLPSHIKLESVLLKETENSTCLIKED